MVVDNSKAEAENEVSETSTRSTSDENATAAPKSNESGSPHTIGDSMKSPFFSFSRDRKPQTATEKIKVKPSKQPKKGRILNALDNFVFSVLRFFLFVVIAAFSGAAAAFLVVQYMSPPEQTSEQQAALTALDEELAMLRDSLQSLRGDVEQSSTSILQIDGVALEVETIKDQVSKSLLQGQELLNNYQSVSDRLTQSEANIVGTKAAIEKINNAISEDSLADTAKEFAARLDTVESNLVSLSTTIQSVPIDAESDFPISETALLEPLTIVDEKIRKLESAQSIIAADFAQVVTAPDLADVEYRLEQLEESNADEFAAKLAVRLSSAEESIQELASPNIAEARQIRRMMLLAVRTAAETGVPYSAMIDDIGIETADFPEVVSMHADTGIATLAELQADFAVKSRDVLSLVDSNSSSDGFFGLLGRLFRVRPLTPRAGDESDAVLSRAEDALRRHDIGGAVSLLESLTAPEQEVMADWSEAASARIAVLAALDSMLTSDPKQ